MGFGHFQWRQAFLPVLARFEEKMDRQECLSLLRSSQQFQNVQSPTRQAFGLLRTSPMVAIGLEINMPSLLANLLSHTQ